MNSRNGGDTAERTRIPNKVLVCGACEAILDGTYEGRGREDKAADEHVDSHHDQEPEVVVLPVSKLLLQEEGPDEVIRVAAQAQRRLREDEEPLAGDGAPDDEPYALG